MNSRTKRETSLIIKYGIAGIANTIVTIAVYFVLRHFSVQEDVSNLLSYAAGILNSFILNKVFVFKDRHSSWMRQGFIFILGAGICWLLQLGTFHLLLPMLPETWAYLLAMLVYNILYYLYNRLITFGKNL